MYRVISPIQVRESSRDNRRMLTLNRWSGGEGLHGSVVFSIILDRTIMHPGNVFRPQDKGERV